jgi:predicted ATPase
MTDQPPTKPSSDRLERIRVQGFRSLREIDITDLGHVTVLIGPNGAGKSNLLAALRMLHEISKKSLRLFVGRAGGASNLLFNGSRETKTVKLCLEFGGDGEKRTAYDAQLEYTGDNSLIFVSERVGARGPDEEAWNWVSMGEGHAESRLREHGEVGAARTVERQLRDLSLFHFHDTSYTSALRNPSRLEDDARLRPDGDNLAAHLRSLRESVDPVNAATFHLIEDLVRQIAPCIHELEPRAIEGGMARLDWVDARGQTFAPHHLSDGTLRAIALFTALTQPAHRLPLFCTIDEPELGLHPAALNLLYEAVRSASARSQLMLVTQSTALLDCFAPGEVIVTERIDDATSFRRLDADKRL